jgi:preprotein translocase subunit SecG
MALFKSFLMIMQALLSVALIAGVLLHSAKGEGLAGIGGQSHLFGSQKGVEAGLNWFTSIVAGLWFAIAILLSILGHQGV